MSAKDVPEISITKQIFETLDHRMLTTEEMIDDLLFNPIYEGHKLEDVCRTLATVCAMGGVEVSEVLDRCVQHIREEHNANFDADCHIVLIMRRWQSAYPDLRIQCFQNLEAATTTTDAPKALTIEEINAMYAKLGEQADAAEDTLKAESHKAHSNRSTKA